MKKTLNRKSHRLIRITLIIVVLQLLTGCVYDVLHLDYILWEDMVQVFSLAGDLLHEEDGQQYVNLFCYSLEGTGCFLVDHDRMSNWTDFSHPYDIVRDEDRIDRRLSYAIIGTLSTQYHRPGYRYQVKIRCWRAVANRVSISCLVDRNYGNGWEPIIVSPFVTTQAEHMRGMPIANQHIWGGEPCWPHPDFVALVSAPPYICPGWAT